MLQIYSLLESFNLVGTELGVNLRIKRDDLSSTVEVVKKAQLYLNEDIRKITMPLLLQVAINPIICVPQHFGCWVWLEINLCNT